MPTFDKHCLLTDFHGIVLVYTKRLKDLLKFFHLKNKTFFHCENGEKNIVWLKKNFKMINTWKNIQQLLNLDILILNDVNRQTNQLMVKFLANVPKLKKIIVLEIEKNYLKSKTDSSKEMLSHLNLKIFLKKKSVRPKNFKRNLSGIKNIYILFRRKNIPIFCKSEFKNLVKFFSFYSNKRLGSILKDKSFFLTINSIYHLKRSPYRETVFLKNNFEDNLQRLTEELGLVSNKIISYQTKDFFYTMGYILL